MHAHKHKLILLCYRAYGFDFKFALFIILCFRISFLWILSTYIQTAFSTSRIPSTLSISLAKKHRPRYSLKVYLASISFIVLPSVMLNIFGFVSFDWLSLRCLDRRICHRREAASIVSFAFRLAFCSLKSLLDVTLNSFGACGCCLAF